MPYIQNPPEENREKAFPDLGGAVLLMILGWTIGIVVGAICTGIPGLQGVLGMGVAEILTALVLLRIGLRFVGSPSHTVLSLRPFSWAIVGDLVIMAASASVLVSEVDNLIQEIFPAPADLLSRVRELMTFTSIPQAMGVILSFVVIPAVAEELMFRGLFQHGLIRNRGTVQGIFYASVCFGIFHLIPWQVVGAFLLGLLLGYVVVRTRSIFPGMILHAFLNLFPLMMIYLSDRLPIPGYNQEAVEGIQHTPLSILAGATILLVLSIFLLTRRSQISEEYTGVRTDEHT